MSKQLFKIVIVEASHIIYEGISNVLTNSGRKFDIHWSENLCDLQKTIFKNPPDIVLINPILIQNQSKDFQILKKELYNTKWLGIVYTFIDQQLLSQFDGIIYINDLPNKIINSIQKQTQDSRQKTHEKEEENLSDREIDVLKLLVEGNANKEIADKLNISTHTVISHRKNISQKTGIKSVSGLTIYSVVNNIISIDNYRE
jgi:DNA-binding CsgD family transcriptional regulator